MDLPSYPYDMAKGTSYWMKQDGKTRTMIRRPHVVALGVNDVPDGTVLIVNYAATEAIIRQEFAKKMASLFGGLRYPGKYYCHHSGCALCGSTGWIVVRKEI